MNRNDKVAKKNVRQRSNRNQKVRRDFQDKKIAEESSKDDPRLGKRYNDPLWYAKNEQMLRDAASYSYNNPVGSALPNNVWETIPNTGISLQVEPQYVPSLMAIRILPTIGISTNSASPANLAANNIYSYVRYMNSGSKNYDQADLMLYLLAMDNLYACWNWMKRIYGYINVYSQYNLDMPKVLAMADQIQITTFQRSLADFRLFLNRAAAQISSFCVPAVMPYFVRHSWMFSNIYKDSDNNKAQMYMFVPDGFYKFSETNSQFGGSLRLVPFKTNDTNTNYTLGQLEQYLESLIEAVAYSEDIGVMSGDILKAYGQDKLFKLTPVEADYRVEPVYNEEVLNQIHNSNAIHVYLDDTNNVYYDVTQDPTTGYLKWNPVIADAKKIPDLNIVNPIINMPWDDVTPGNTMVGTRLTAIPKIVKGATGYDLSIATCGTEIVTHYKMFMANGSSGAVPYDIVNLESNYLDSLNTGFEESMKIISAMSQFDWHPLIYAFSRATGSDTTFIYNGVIGDIANYTQMNVSDLQKLNLTAIMSEFNIPQLSSF